MAIRRHSNIKIGPYYYGDIIDLMFPGGKETTLCIKAKHPLHRIKNLRYRFENSTETLCKIIFYGKGKDITQETFKAIITSLGVNLAEDRITITLHVVEAK